MIEFTHHGITVKCKPENAATYRAAMDKPPKPRTVAEKLYRASEEGMFNTFMGEFNFADLPEEDLMRSIQLFGTKVIPELRDFEPF